MTNTTIHRSRARCCVTYCHGLAEYAVAVGTESAALCHFHYTDFNLTRATAYELAGMEWIKKSAPGEVTP